MAQLVERCAGDRWVASSKLAFSGLQSAVAQLVERSIGDRIALVRDSPTAECGAQCLSWYLECYTGDRRVSRSRLSAG